MTELSDKAKSICESKYNTNCGGCPIRPACAAHIGLGQVGLESWTTKVNDMAKEVENDG